jgi:hypothetical protein
VGTGDAAALRVADGSWAPSGGCTGRVCWAAAVGGGSRATGPRDAGLTVSAMVVTTAAVTVASASPVVTVDLPGGG